MSSIYQNLYNKLNNNNTLSYLTIKKLLDIFKSNNDNEIKIIFYKYIINFTFKTIFFQSFSNFINRIHCINDEDFYTSFNDYLDKIIKLYNKDLKFLNKTTTITTNINNGQKIQNTINNDIETKINKQKNQLTINTDIKPSITTNTKKPITATLKRLVWNKYIGEDFGKSKCLCCKVTYITQLSFNCGHVIAESKGGETNVSNLRPICQNCNSSMGTANMNDFTKSFN